MQFSHIYSGTYNIHFAKRFKLFLRDIRCKSSVIFWVSTVSSVDGNKEVEMLGLF